MAKQTVRSGKPPAAAKDVRLVKGMRLDLSLSDHERLEAAGRSIRQSQRDGMCDRPSRSDCRPEASPNPTAASCAGRYETTASDRRVLRIRGWSLKSP